MDRKYLSISSCIHWLCTKTESQPLHLVFLKGYVNWVNSRFIKKNGRLSTKPCSFWQNDAKKEGRNILKLPPLTFWLEDPFPLLNDIGPFYLWPKNKGSVYPLIKGSEHFGWCPLHLTGAPCPLIIGYLCLIISVWLLIFRLKMKMS